MRHNLGLTVYKLFQNKETKGSRLGYPLHRQGNGVNTPIVVGALGISDIIPSPILVTVKAELSSDNASLVCHHGVLALEDGENRTTPCVRHLMDNFRGLTDRNRRNGY